jgi:phenylacetic acid degradation operon negative regulatory protein
MIDNIYGQRNVCAMEPSAKSLTLDLLSTLSNGTMPVRALVAAAELFGIEENSLRVSLARLYAAGSVERDERGRYRLGHAGSTLTRQVRGWRALETRVEAEWAGGWVGIIGAPRGRNAAANRSARALDLLGFRCLRESLHVRPNNLVGGVASIRTRYADLCAADRSARPNQTSGSPAPSAPVITQMTDLDAFDAANACGLWNAEELERRYQQALNELIESEVRVAALSPSEAMVETFLVGGRVLRDLVIDPLLPEPIIDRSMRRDLVTAMLRYDRIGRAKWALFLAHFDAPHMKMSQGYEPETRIQ